MSASQSRAPKQLNDRGCVIRVEEKKGRCVYADRSIPRGTLIEISPVLLFSKEEYEEHGRHTVVDHYTFKWPNGRMALALGLGSLFNHHDPPNVSFTLDTYTEAIHYTTVRDIQPGEELCIFYGHNLWFTPSDPGLSATESSEEISSENAWEALSAINIIDMADAPQNPYANGKQDGVLSEEELPFIRYKLPPEEETPESIRTVNAWVVDIPDARHINTLIKWLKQANLETPDVAHLKRIRKDITTNQSTLLLALGNDSKAPSPAPPLPPGMGLNPPYLIPVPMSAALTLPSLALKSTIWPTMYTPKRKDEVEPWRRGQVAWAWKAMRAALEAARQGKEAENQIPIGAHIPAPHGSPEGTPSFGAHDTRNSTSHPLRHAAVNAIRKLADYHASVEDTKVLLSSTKEVEDPEDAGQNGTNYLLTGRTVFLTHEPCIMCTMSLLHSRVKEVIYLYPMPETGGCGGLTCLPTLKGVNHRFTICRWTDMESLGLRQTDENDETTIRGSGGEDLRVDTKLDA